MSVTSAGVLAIGFSRMKFFPALAAATAWSRCWLGSPVTSTMSTPGSASMASRSRYTRIGVPYFADSSAASSGRDEQTAVTRPCRVALIAAMWAVAAQP